jgi:DNA (cytosine-5)-methyltransferase 1
MRVLDLFSGIGGFSFGLERAGMRTVAFCEIDHYARRVLEKLWPGVPIYGDVKTLTADRLAADGIAADVICGGFPCQDISAAGRGVGIEGERSGLWFEMLRLITECRPAWVLAENVPALRNRGADTVLDGLERAGYTAWPLVVGADDVGAPHRRKRVWIVAHAGRSGRRQNTRGALGNQSQDEGRREAHDYKSNRHGESRGARDVAHANGVAKRKSRHEAETLGVGRETRMEPGGRCNGQHQPGPGENMADANGISPVGPAISRAQCGSWATEPELGRVANGIPHRVDRLRCLGNAVVPLIPELIGRAIMQAGAA